MKPTISVFVITHWRDKFHLKNCLRSMVDLKPDEVCIFENTKSTKLSKRYQKWIREYASNLGLPIKITHSPWTGSYKDACNAGLKMCTKEWAVRVDSDEMLTKELCRDLRDKIKSLPPETLVLRPKRISLIDDNHCLDNLWKGPNQRLPTGSHGRIFKLGYGKYTGSNIHETYAYPGRTEIPWNDPKHPKKDWHGYYILHLWLYKDNFMRRSWAAGDFPYRQLMQDVLEIGLPKDDLWRIARYLFLKKRRYKIRKMPRNGISWTPIRWTVGKDWTTAHKKYWENQVSENINREVI